MLISSNNCKIIKYEVGSSLLIVPSISQPLLLRHTSNTVYMFMGNSWGQKA